jgi:hypothetical protein
MEGGGGASLRGRGRDPYMQRHVDTETGPGPHSMLNKPGGGGGGSCGDSPMSTSVHIT